jgi:hypothetical protein
LDLAWIKKCADRIPTQIKPIAEDNRFKELNASDTFKVLIFSLKKYQFSNISNVLNAINASQS